MQYYKPPIEAPLSIVVKTIYKSEYSNTCFPCGKVQTCQSLDSQLLLSYAKKKNSYYLKNKTIICHLNCSNDHTSITIKLSPKTSNIQTSLISNLSQWKQTKKKTAPPTCTFLPSLTLLHCYTFAFLSEKIMDFCNWEIKYGAVEADFIREESSVLSTPSWMNPNC